jgi:hypothetical protein
MRLAWFRPAESRASTPLIAQLSAQHTLDLYTRANAHDFVWTHFRSPYELCVFELDNSAAYAFIWPYLLHYGGVLLLTSPTLHDSRARALAVAGRLDDYAVEFCFSEGHPLRSGRTPPRERKGPWPMLRVPLAAARVTVVPNRALADALRDQYPHARIVHAPLVVQPAETPLVRSAVAAPPVTFGVLADDRVEVARRALVRAQTLGTSATLIVGASPEHILRDAHVVLVLPWPPGGQVQQLAHGALAAGLPVAALETILTADWPALDPQTWRPRGRSADRPVAVTIDPRDEEHSLALTMRRLSADAALRSALGEAAYAWSRAHEGGTVAVDAWQRLLREAAQADPPHRPTTWPSHLTPDGTERARAMLAEFGVTVDLFD